MVLVIFKIFDQFYMEWHSPISEKRVLSLLFNWLPGCEIRLRSASFPTRVFDAEIRSWRDRFFLCPRDYKSGGILFYPCPSVHRCVCACVRSSHLVCIVCPPNSSYNLWARPFIFWTHLVPTLKICILYWFWFLTIFYKIMATWTLADFAISI